jgi:hypothetical protein
MSGLHLPLLTLMTAAKILHIDSVDRAVLETERDMIIKSAVIKIERLEDEEPTFMIEDSNEEEDNDLMYDSDEEDTPEDEPVGNGAITMTDLVCLVKKCNQANKNLREENRDLRKDLDGLQTLNGQALTGISTLQAQVNVVDNAQNFMFRGVTQLSHKVHGMDDFATQLSNKVHGMDGLLKVVDKVQDRAIDSLFYLVDKVDRDRA